MKKMILGVVIGVLVGTASNVIASNLLASNIAYTPKDSTWGVNNVEAAIDSLKLSKTSDNYSTEEKVVGTWIDGKPLYQKTITFTPTTNTETTYKHNIENVDEIFFDFDHSYVYTETDQCYWFAKTGNDNQTNAHYWSFVWAKRDSFSVIVGNGMYQRSPKGYITFQYTKTTD